MKTDTAKKTDEALKTDTVQKTNEVPKTGSSPQNTDDSLETVLYRRGMNTNEG
jgi:hypothetical protein